MNAQVKATTWHTIYEYITVSTQLHLEDKHALTEVHNNTGFSDEHILTTQLGTIDPEQSPE